MNDELPPDPFADEPIDESAEANTAGSGRVGGTGPGSGGADPFAAFSMLGPMFGDLAKMFSAQQTGPNMRWETARQIAAWSASEGAAEENVDPLGRIRLEELARVAEMHVSEISGLDVSPAGRGVQITTVTRAAWALNFIDEQLPLLDVLSTMNGTPSVAFSAPDPNNPEAFLSGLMGFIQPALIALQVGSMAGHLGRLSFGSYDLPLPRPSGDRLNLVPANIAGFAKEWSLGLDAVQMRLLLGELAHHAVLRLPHVAEKLQALLHRYADGYAIDAASLEGRLDSLLGGFDPTNPGAMGEAFADPTKLWESAITPAQREATRDITTVVTVIEGWVEHVVARASARLLGGDHRLDEALRRRRLSGSSGDRMTERLLGISVDQAAFDRGSAFVKGVIERAGDDALPRLWHSAESLPTRNEIEAPGLWLARLNLD